MKGSYKHSSTAKKLIPFDFLPNGEIFKLTTTNEIMVKVTKTKVLVIVPDEFHEDEKGKVVQMVEKDMESLCLAIDPTKFFYK